MSNGAVCACGWTFAVSPKAARNHERSARDSWVEIIQSNPLTSRTFATRSGNVHSANGTFRLVSALAINSIARSPALLT